MNSNQQTKLEIMNEVARKLFSPFEPYSIYMIDNMERNVCFKATDFMSQVLYGGAPARWYAQYLDELIDGLQELALRVERARAALADVREQIEAAPAE